MEKILEIKEVKNVKSITPGEYDRYDGYQITTDKRTIMILITNDSQCCEDWGYLASNDNFNDFIGCELTNVSITDTSLKTYDVDLSDLEDGGAIFVNFETSNGTLQFAVYNAHNGYYGHYVKVFEVGADSPIKEDCL